MAGRSRYAPSPEAARVRREANRSRLAMRSSRDGGYYLFQPFAGQAVPGLEAEEAEALGQLSATATGPARGTLVARGS